jgi:tetrahydromethanopterin S-methyltransferase subunit D
VKRISKLIGTLLGGATGAGVTGILALLGVTVDPGVAAAIAVLLAAAGAYLAPANRPPAPAGLGIDPKRYSS